MAYEKGGRADKYGNRFEYNWIIYNLLDVVKEKISYVMIEAIGEDEKGVDLWIGNVDGTREGQQCKGRYGDEDQWTYGMVNAKGIFANWKKQLELSPQNHIALVSPLSFTVFEDLLQKAKDTDNSKPKDFYEYQIKQAGKNTKDFFDKYCKVMGLDEKKDEDIQLAINYLSRSHYRQIPDAQLKEMILDKISMRYVGNPEDIYAKFLRFILTEDTYGQRIDALRIKKFCDDTGIIYRDLSRDDTILPRIDKLNKEYCNTFFGFSKGLLPRSQAEYCQKAILEGKSVVLHGKAGEGKSGCVQNLIYILEDLSIPYLAIKLDHRVPEGTSSNWGKKIGLPDSISYCLDAVAKDRSGVLILDQLDALRWTQSHSGEALSVCMEIIHEVANINLEREKKISVVMVCRTYDLENDRNINGLFMHEEGSVSLEWEKIAVGKLSADEVKKIVGNTYNLLHAKLKSLLQTASNLYIWEQLDKSKNYSEIQTTQQLIQRWWEELHSKAEKAGIQEEKLNEVKDRFVNICDKYGKITVPRALLNVSSDSCDFLQTNRFFVVNDNVVSLAHQSILDYFLVQNMLEKVCKDCSIEEIIGGKEKQTPGRRYQVQMLFQQLQEIWAEKFLGMGEMLLNSESIRFNLKYVFIEILSQIEQPDQDIFLLVKKYIQNPEWQIHFLDGVVLGKKQYLIFLRDVGVLDTWMESEELQDQVIRLYASISPDFDNADIGFIEKYALKEKENIKWGNCFLRNIDEDSDELFELRLKVYDKYPDLLEYNVDIISMLKVCQIRTVRILALMLEKQKKRNGETLYRYEEKLVSEDVELFNSSYREVVSILLPHVPLNGSDLTKIYAWSARYMSKYALERTCIEILKKANRKYAQNQPEEFMEILKTYMGTGMHLHNEIVFDALKYLPNQYADYIADYLCTGLERTMIEDTSGNKDALLLSKGLVGDITARCSEESYKKIEYGIIHFIPANAKRTLKGRIEFNREKQKNGGIVTWRFWGFFQKEMLGILPGYRISGEARNLLSVLQRSIPGEYSPYHYNDGHGGSVWSPVARKKLFFRNWKGIITNKKIPKERTNHWKEVKGGFIESTVFEFASDFRGRVSEDPTEFLQNMLDFDGEVVEEYVNALFAGIAYSEHLDEIDITLLEKMFEKYEYDYEKERAQIICRIIEKRKDVSWSDAVIEMLIDIAGNHKNPKPGESCIASNDTKTKNSVETLETDAINCTRGIAASAIGHLLWERKELFEKFKPTIIKLMQDENTAVRFASLDALWPIYNVDKAWTVSNVLSVFKSDNRTIGCRGSKCLFVCEYERHKRKMKRLLKKAFFSSDKRLIQISGYAIAEIYLRYDAFENILNQIASLNKEQADALLEMFIVYLGLEEYNSKVKAILYKVIELGISMELDHTWARIFYDERIELKRDKEFLKKLMSSDVGGKLLYVFMDYFKKGQKLYDYAEIIIDTGKSMFQDQKKVLDADYLIEYNLSKLMIALYDEVCNTDIEKNKEYEAQCLDIWDLMFENRLGITRDLTEKLTEM